MQKKNVRNPGPLATSLIRSVDEPNLRVQLPVRTARLSFLLSRAALGSSVRQPRQEQVHLGDFLLAVVFFLQPRGKHREGAVCSACGLSLFLHDGQDSCPVTSAGSCSH